MASGLLIHHQDKCHAIGNHRTRPRTTGVLSTRLEQASTMGGTAIAKGNCSAHATEARSTNRMSPGSSQAHRSLCAPIHGMQQWLDDELISTFKPLQPRARCVTPHDPWRCRKESSELWYRCTTLRNLSWTGPNRAKTDDTEWSRFVPHQNCETPPNASAGSVVEFDSGWHAQPRPGDSSECKSKSSSCPCLRSNCSCTRCTCQPCRQTQNQHPWTHGYTRKRRCPKPQAATLVHTHHEQSRHRQRQIKGGRECLRHSCKQNSTMRGCAPWTGMTRGRRALLLRVETERAALRRSTRRKKKGERTEREGRKKWGKLIKRRKHWEKGQEKWEKWRKRDRRRTKFFFFKKSEEVK